MRKISEYGRLVKSLIGLGVSDEDVLVVRTILHRYLKGVGAHVDLFGPNHGEEWASQREVLEGRARAYWTERLLGALQAPLRQPVGTLLIRVAEQSEIRNKGRFHA